MIRYLLVVVVGLLTFGGLVWALTTLANIVIDRMAGRDDDERRR